MKDPLPRIDNLSERDKLWELYLHTLCGHHFNIGANKYTGNEIEESALESAKLALKHWNENK